MSQTDPLKRNDRVINGLFHSRCLDFDANEKIILKPALSEYDAYKGKTNFKMNYAFDKTTRLLEDENFSDLTAYFMRVYMTCLIFLSTSQLI